MRKLGIVLVPLLIMALVIGVAGCGEDGATTPTQTPTTTPTPTATPALDSDGDGWTDAQEQIAGTDPYGVDTDGDGYWDPQDPNPLDSNIPVPAATPTPTPTQTSVPTPTPTPTPTSSPTSKGYAYGDGSSRLQPAPIDTLLRFIEWDYEWDEGRVFYVSVEEVYRGAEAWDMIHARSSFNVPPRSGYEYILVKAYVSYSKGSWTEAIGIWKFDLLSESGELYDPLSQTFVSHGSKPRLGDNCNSWEGDCWPGESTLGWMAFEVLVNDRYPVLAFGYNQFSKSGGVWFALQ